MLLSKTLKFYKRKDIQKLIVKHAKNKEIGVRYAGGYFGKRPDTLVYENDVLALAKKKATSFHVSEETWSNPLQLNPDLKQHELDELRKGWDLILDIDCHHFTYSKIATHLLIKILTEYGIKSVTCKFSGNKGFHIAIPYEAFPETVNNEPTKKLFPDAPRRIAYHLRDKLKPLLEKAIMRIEKNSVANVAKRTGIETKELILEEEPVYGGKPSLNVEAFLEIDTILIAPRHLYRMPYSFHEKSELVSVPVDINKILKFTKEMATPENIDLKIPFLEREKAVKGEASQLIINAFDFYPREEEKRERKEYSLPEEAIPEELFPPCIKIMLQGMKDGKKRATFTLINFLKGVSWTADAIEETLYEWNKKNPEPLREVYLKGQLKQGRKAKEAIPPHNCPHAGNTYYKDMQVCQPDNFCKKIKNPLQYATLKQKLNTKNKGRSRLTEEQKEMRRKYREKKKKESEN